MEEMKFNEISFEEQTAIINACLVNTAKLINSKQDGIKNTSFRDCLLFLYENKEEAFNEAFLICLERLEDKKYNSLPLALYVSKACGKALRKLFYWNAKSASEKIDTEIELSSHFDNVEYSTLKNANMDCILSHIREEIQVNCVRLINLIEYGFTFEESRQIMDISENTMLKYTSAIANAIALQYAEEKAFSMAEKILASDRSFKDKLSHMQAEKALANMKACKIESKSPIVKWEDKAQIAIDFSKLPYMEKIAFISNQKALWDKAVKAIF